MKLFHLCNIYVFFSVFFFQVSNIMEWLNKIIDRPLKVQKHEDGDVKMVFYYYLLLLLLLILLLYCCFWFYCYIVVVVILLNCCCCCCCRCYVFKIVSLNLICRKNQCFFFFASNYYFSNSQIWNIFFSRNIDLLLYPRYVNVEY